VATAYSRDRLGRLVASGVVWAFLLGNVVAIVWLWIANHNLDFSFAPNYWATLMARLGGLTGLLAAFTPLVQVLLLARLPFLGRLIGFDRLTVWHRWNGYLCLSLVVAHTVMAVLGFSLDGKTSFFHEFWRLVADNILTGMVTATIGLALFLLVTVSSLAIEHDARRAGVPRRSLHVERFAF
jgi:predicted ferric reductase